MNTKPRQKFTNWLLRQQQALLLGHLLVLHALTFGGWKVAGIRLLWPLAVGFLLLWQPFVEGERRIGKVQGTALLALVLAFTVLLNPWWLLIWCGALAAVIGGRVFLSLGHLERTAYLGAFGYLVALIMLGVVPEIAPNAIAIDPLSPRGVALYLPLLLPLLLFCPAHPPVRRQGDSFDFLYALLVFLLLAVLVLGSISFMLLGRAHYLEAVFVTSLTLAAALLLLAWVWNPRAGFSGIGSVFARYLLSVGMPLEQWVGVLKEESENESDPQRFLSSVLQRLSSLPWVAGGAWNGKGFSAAGSFGEVTGYGHELVQEKLWLKLYFRHAPSPAMRWHFDWLLHLAAEVYLIKQQTQELQRISYLQAVYETGARVTHDVKNLLQSLQTLCYAAAQPGEPEALAQLLGRQLPRITERLHSTLEKLQRPQAADEMMPVAQWWQALSQRYAGQGIIWQEGENIVAEALLPADLFDSVAENLLQNALQKRQQVPGLGITVGLQMAGMPASCVLNVSDDGAAVACADQLLQQPVPSAQGLGIGLYHAARLAEAHGYRLQLLENVDGAVCFSLRQMADGH